MTADELEAYAISGIWIDRPEPAFGTSRFDSMDRSTLLKMWKEEIAIFAGRDRNELEFYAVHGEGNCTRLRVGDVRGWRWLFEHPRRTGIGAYWIGTYPPPEASSAPLRGPSIGSSLMVFLLIGNWVCVLEVDHGFDRFQVAEEYKEVIQVPPHVYQITQVHRFDPFYLLSRTCVDLSLPVS